MGLDFNFNFNLNDVTLDKLYKDANNNNTTDFSYSKNITPTSYSNSVNKYGGISNGNVETLDLSPLGVSPKDNNINFDSPMENNTSKILNGDDDLSVDKNINDNKGKSINQNFKSSNENATTNTNNKGLSTSENSNILDNNIKEKEKSNISEEFKNKQGSNTTKKFETTTGKSSVSGMGNNTNNNTSNATTVNKETNNDNIFDSDKLNFDNLETNELNEITNEVFTTKVDNNISDVVSEVDVDSYINSLVKNGLRMEDINRVLNGSISLDSLMVEIQNDTDTSRKKEIMEASYLSAYGLEFSNMESLKLEIDNLKNELENLIKEKKSINDSREFESLMDIIVRLKNGENLDNILSSQVVAWKYIDENGNVAYRYDTPSATEIFENEKKYEPLYYEDMYKNSAILGDLKKVLTKSTTKSLFSNEKKDVYIWDGTENQEKFFDSLLKKYESNNLNKKEKLEELEENINKYQEQLLQYNNLYSTINSEVDYYLNYVDKYMTKEDFELNNKCSINTSEILEKLSKSKNNITISDSFGGSISKTYVNEESDLVDVLMCMINDTSLVLSGANGVVNLDSDNNILEIFKKWIPFLTESEKEVINYIYNTEGSSQVYQYLENISKELDNRYVADKTQKDQEYASEHPVLASLASIVVTPIEGLGAACYSINSLIREEEIRKTNTYSSGDVWRNQVANDIAQNYGGGWSFLYSTGMSMADSVSMIGVTVATGGVATPVISATLMGSRAYVSTLNDALDRGLSDGSAVGLAFSSAVVETAMESYSLGHLMNLETKLGESTSKLVLKVADKIPNETLANIATKTTYIASSAISQGLAEGEEEFATEILNFVFDDIISGDLSNHTLTINNYISLGYSEEEARQLANMDFANQLGQAFLGGFVSGICFGTFGGVTTTHNVSKNIAKNIEEKYNGNSAKAFAEGIEINRILQENSLNEYNKNKKEQLLSLGNKIKSLFNQKQYNVKSNDHIQDIIYNINKAYSIASQSGSINTLISKAKGKQGKVAGVELFNILGYNAKPTSITNDEFQKLSEESKYGVIVRGIAGPDSKEYVNQLKNGEMYVGGEHESIKGTGIYTGFGLKSKEIGEKYSTRSGTELNGEIVEMLLDSSANVVEYDTIVEEQNKVLDEMSKKYIKYSSDIKDFDTLFSNLDKITNTNELQEAKFITNFLADTGYYAALNGYDAIVDSKVNYLTVLNRGKLYVKEDKVNNLNNEEVEVIKVADLDTSINEFDRYAVNLNTTYIGYDYVVKPKGDLNTILEQIINNNDGSKILIQLSNINDITLEMLEKVPDNINFRIIDYSMEFYQTFRKSRQNTVNAISEHLTYNVEELKLIIKEFDNIKNGIDKNWNNYQKAQYIYNYMVNNIEYQKPFGIVGRNKHFDGLMSLVDKVSTCQGFAHTYSAILNNIGIKCFEVWGNMNGEGNHAYNIVSIDGNNFIVDTTRESINKSNPGKFEGTGFGVQNVEQYAAVSNVDLFNKLNSTYDTISQNLVQQNNYTNEINGTESVEELHEKLAKIAESGQPISLDFLENKSIEEIYNYIKDNISEINILVQSKQIQEFIEKYYGEYPRQFTNTIINNLSRKNITPKIINQILKFNDEQFIEFVKFNENSTLFENDEIFNRAIATGINFIYGLNDSIKLKMINNDDYINLIKNSTSDLSNVAKEISSEYLELFLDRIGFNEFEISEQFEILRLVDLDENMQLQLINSEEYINYCKKTVKENIYKFSNIFSKYSADNIELLLDNLDLKSLSISLQFNIINQIFDVNPNIDSECKKRIIEKSDIFSNSNLIKFYNLENLLKKIKDSKLVYDICNMESVFSMLNKEFYYITNVMKYLDTSEQLQFIENKEFLAEINIYDLNNLIKSVSGDTVETLLAKYPKIQNYLNSTTFLEIYLKTNKDDYLLELKNLIANNKISSFYDLQKIISENNLFDKFATNELDIIFENSKLNLIVDNISKIEDIKYKEYFNNLLNKILDNKASWTVDEAMAVSDIISFDAFLDIISQFNNITYYNVKDNIDKLSDRQREVVCDKIKISELLGYISNENVYNYVLEKFKKNPDILQDVIADDMPRYGFINDTELQRINELISLVNDNDKLKFISFATIKNEQFVDQMLNIVKNNPELIINVSDSMIPELLSKFSYNDRISLYYKMGVNNLTSVYSNELSLDERNILMQLIIKKFEDIDNYRIVELMKKMDSKSQYQLINNINKFEMSTFSFSELLNSVKDDNVLGLIFKKFAYKYTLDDSKLGEFIANMDNNILNIFRQNCPNDILIRSFNILLSNDFKNEIVKRFDNNPRLFYNLPKDINLTYFNFLTEEHFNNYINNYIYDNIKNINYNEIKILLEDSTLKEKFNFIYAHQDGLITKEKFNFLLNLKQKNKYVLSTFNYNLFDDTIYQLGPNLLSKLSKYYDVVDQIVELKSNSEKFNLFANMIISNNDSSVLVQDQKMAMILDYLLENELDASVLNYSNMNDVEIARNIILKDIDMFSLLGVENTGRSIIKLEEYNLSNYYEELSNKCDSLLKEATTVEEVQNLIFNKYFSICMEDAKKLFKIYGSSFSNIKKLDTNGIATTYLENMYNILNASSMEEAIDLYNTFNSNYDMDETLTIINEIKKIYTRSLKETLFVPKDIVDYVEYNGIKIPVYAPKDDFQMLVHSTAAYGKMALINDNYFDSWNLSNRTANHGICCSLISNNNMGVANINDILLGFNSFTDEQINMMAPYDIYTRNDGYLIKSGRPLLYLSGKDVMNETRHTHNEFNLERTNLTGEGNLANIQPDYVIIFDDMDIELKNKAYKASIEFNIPLVYLNRETLAINEKNKIDNLISEFKTTYNVNLLKDILVLHENNRSGYRVSKPNFVTQYFPSDKIIQILNGGIENAQSREDLLYIKEILEEENAKFDATHEATNRTNIIDIPVEDMINKINDKLNTINSDILELNSLNVQNFDDIESNVQGAFNILTDEVNDVEFTLKPEHENDTVRLISIKELLNIIKNDNMYDEFTTHKYFNRNTKYLVSDITRDEYLEAFVQLYHAIKNNSYSLGLTFFQNLRLKKIYNFALKSLDISKIQYDYSLPKEIKLNMMFNNKKIYNYKDVIILYNYYNENFALNTLLTNPKLYVSDDYSFYLEVLNKYYNDNKKNLSNKDLTFWNALIKTQMKLNDIILKNNIDLGEKGFNKFLSNITSWTKEVNDYVNFYSSIYKVDIATLNYNSEMPNNLKLELMRRDKTIYDENLLINEMNKAISNNVSPTIICDELYWLYYNIVSKYHNSGNNKYDSYYNMCRKVYIYSLSYIIDNNVDLSEKQFKIFMRELGNNINIVRVQNYIENYLKRHSIDISEYLNKIIYKETLPKQLRIQTYQKVLENSDWYLRGNSNINYGVNQNSVALYMRFKINNLNWLDEENFKEYLIDKHNYKVEDADSLLKKIKERVGKYIDPRKGSLIIEYIYEKCLRENRFDVLDIIDNSFSFKFSDEFTRLTLKLEQLGIGDLDAIRILSAIDSTGCCSYASVLNGIFMAYRNNSSAFERDFGYPMYIDVNGNKELNSGELMLDVYTFINSNKCGGSLFIYEDDGTLKINDLTTENQIYITTIRKNNGVYHKDDLINDFLKFKKANSRYVVDKSAYFEEGKVSDNHILTIKEDITNFLIKVPTGSIELGLWRTKDHEFRLLNSKRETYKTTNSWSEGAGHAVCITGVLDKYFIISSWGKRLFIPIEDFINNEFNIIFRHMEGIE